MVVLITGASGGFGAVLGEVLSKRGMKVYGTMRTPDGERRPFTMLPMEVTSDESVAAAIQAVLDREGRIDVVVNCVNQLVIGSVEETSVDDMEAVYQANVFGIMRVCKHVVPVMRRQAGGTIVNMSSLGGLLAVPFMSAYTSAKFALEAFSEALYHEVKADGISVVIMQPVAMHMNRPATGSHLRLVDGAQPESFSHKVAMKMAADTEASKLTPEMVAERIHSVITRDAKPLRVPMDKARAVAVVKRVAPQSVIDKLIGGLMKSAAAAE